ncbi:hypothetical protein EAG_09159, partial [Camponotus floridanus]
NEQNIGEQVCDKTNEEKSKLWTNELTLGLIALVEEHQNQFQNSVKKYVWMKISNILQDKFSSLVTWQQCDTKWKGLLKMYKDIKEHNSTSGKGRKRWEYFEVMNNILHNKLEITPVATCSSSKGLVINKELTTSTDETSQREQSPRASKETWKAFQRLRRPSGGVCSATTRSSSNLTSRAHPILQACIRLGSTPIYPGVLGHAHIPHSILIRPVRKEVERRAALGGTFPLTPADPEIPIELSVSRNLREVPRGQLRSAEQARVKTGSHTAQARHTEKYPARRTNKCARSR